MKHLEITPGFIAALCVLGLLNQRGMVWTFLAATAAHETGHLIALRLFGTEILAFRLDMLDAQIVSAPLGYRQELCAALAGPAMSIVCCLMFRRRFAAFAAVSLLQGLFNLLPIWPLDGGRALRAALGLRVSLVRSERICRITGGIVCAAGLLGAMVCAGKFGLGIGPVLVWCTVLLRLAWYGQEERLDSQVRVRYNI